MEKIDILMAGVGGQGTILASNILAEVGIKLGYEVKKSEVHGMAQRGGTVESHVRWGENVYAPLVEQGHADYLLGFEMLEAARWPIYLQEGTVAVVNSYRIPPLAVSLGKADYPSEQDVESLLEAAGGRVVWVDGTGIATGLGNPAAAGVVLLGALSNILGGGEETWLGVIRDLVPEKFLDLNEKAFYAGRSYSAAR